MSTLRRKNEETTSIFVIIERKNYDWNIIVYLWLVCMNRNEPPCFCKCQEQMRQSRLVPWAMARRSLSLCHWIRCNYPLPKYPISFFHWLRLPSPRPCNFLYPATLEYVQEERCHFSEKYDKINMIRKNKEIIFLEICSITNYIWFY